MCVRMSKSVHASLPLGVVCENLKYLLNYHPNSSPLDGRHGSWEEDLCY